MAESFKRKGFGQGLLDGIVIVVFPEQKNFLGAVSSVKANSVLETLVEKGAAFKVLGNTSRMRGVLLGASLKAA